MIVSLYLEMAMHEMQPVAAGDPVVCLSVCHVAVLCKIG